MARKTAQSFAELPTINFGNLEGEYNVGEEFSGYYKGKRLVKTKYKDETPIYTFQTEAGDVNVWGSTNLNQKMDQVQLGSMTFITFTGLKKSKERGKQPMKLFNVDYDDADSIHVEVAKVSFTNEAADDSGDDGQDDDQDSGIDNEEAQDEPKQVASTRTSKPAPAAKTGNAAAAASVKDRLAAMKNTKRPAA